MPVAFFAADDVNVSHNDDSESDSDSLEFEDTLDMWLSNNNVIAGVFLAASCTCGTFIDDVDVADKPGVAIFLKNDVIHSFFLGGDFSPVSPLLLSPIIKN